LGGVIAMKGPVIAPPSKEMTVKLSHLSLSLLSLFTLTTLVAGCAEDLETLAPSGAASNSATPGSGGGSVGGSGGANAGGAKPTPTHHGGGAAGGSQIANPAAVYCAQLGYSDVEGRCVFPDGTQCEQWAFFLGACGAEQSYCQAVAHGERTTETLEIDGSTAQVVTCTLPDGSRCEEFTLASGKGCVPPPSATSPTVAPGGDPPGGAALADPSAEYCLGLGFSVDGAVCTLPDGSTCERWAFYRGECGSEYSFCTQHGGIVSSVTEDMGSWTAQYALCTLADGTSCLESDFAQTGTCR
jgi:putative hemolysin